MKKDNLYLLLLLLLFASCNSTKQGISKTTHSLNSDWQFKSSNDSIWRNASVPGSNYTDLLYHGLIPDPYDGANEQKVQWVAELDWEYKLTFDVNADLLANNNIVLNFDGLDTYAKVYLNDEIIVNSDNMFRKWNVKCKELLKEGSNSLHIKFESPISRNILAAQQDSYQLPDNRVYTRKAPYQFGWDWGPKLITSGIWKPVTLVTWNSLVIKDIYFKQTELNKTQALFDVVGEIESDLFQKVNIEVWDRTNNICLTKTMRDQSDSESGSSFSIPIVIDKPKLWWPNGLGEAYLYDLEVIVSNNDFSETFKHNIGIREIKLITAADSIGSSFYFEVNGIPVFAKGANYIPQDNFTTRVDSQRYERTIKAAVDANMNMLRVWGGGIYESNYFYELCDKHGIMIWQDFMYACAMYPGDKAFIRTAGIEAQQQIARLRNHPCLALWCGNNEVDNGWKDWGWQKQLAYSTEDSIEIYSNYKLLFEETLPDIVRLLDPNTQYWPSSPLWGWGHDEANTEGDSHYWGVWWGHEPFSMYEKKVGRFMSEYGFQAFPHQATIDSFAGKDDKYLFSEVMKAHQKHLTGYETILKYMEREYPVPTNFDDFSYMSQVLQADGIELGIKAHRRAMPHCMGTLYWQLNDCWPVVSWSSIDYYHRWKALHYRAQDCFKNYMISAVLRQDQIEVFLVSDSLANTKGSLEMSLISFSGDILWSKNLSITQKANSSSLQHSINVSELPRFDKQNTFLNIQFNTEEKTLAEETIYFAATKHLKLENPEIKIEQTNHNKGVLLTITSNTLVKDLQLSVKGEVIHFSNNCFDLLPDSPIKVFATGIGVSEGIKIELTHIHKVAQQIE